MKTDSFLPEDLIPTFIECLEYLDNENKFTKIIQEGKDIIKKAEEDEKVWEEEDTISYLNEDLFDALSNFAPSYCYFGSHTRNFSDYGFWPSEEIEEDFEGLKVSDLSEVPEDFEGEILLVNDHGNTTLYSKSSDDIHKEWSIV